MTGRTVWVVFVVLITCSYSFAQNDHVVSGYDLRPKWEEGQASRYQYETTRKHRVTTQHRRSHKVEDKVMVSVGEVSVTVKEKRPDGSYVCILVNVWKTLEITYPGGQILKLDSRDKIDLDNEWNARFVANIGIPLEVHVRPDGTVIDVIGIDKINERISPELRHGSEKILMFKRNAAAMLALEGVPESIDVKESWSVQHTWPWYDPPYQGIATFDAINTLGRVEDQDGFKVAVVDAHAQPRIDIDRSKLSKDHPPFEEEVVESELSFQFIYDPARSESVRRYTKQHVVVDYKIHYPMTTVQRRLEQTVEGTTVRIATE